MMFLSRRLWLQTGLATAATLLGTWVLKLARAASPAFLRPPGAGPESEFHARCIRCAQCIAACPTHVLHSAPLTAGTACGTPFLIPRERPCNLCQGEPRMQCISVCPTEALRPLQRRQDVRMGLAVIDPETCLPFLGIICKACWHACPFPREAITFDPRGRPTVVNDACVGCGLCEYACPTTPASIRIVPNDEKRVMSDE